MRFKINGGSVCGGGNHVTVAIDRIVSAVRESGLTSPAAIRTFLLNKEFEV